MFDIGFVGFNWRGGRVLVKSKAYALPLMMVFSHQNVSHSIWFQQRWPMKQKSLKFLWDRMCSTILWSVLKDEFDYDGYKDIYVQKKHGNWTTNIKATEGRKKQFSSSAGVSAFCYSSFGSAIRWISLFFPRLLLIEIALRLYSDRWNTMVGCKILCNEPGTSLLITLQKLLL